MAAASVWLAALLIDRCEVLYWQALEVRRFANRKSMNSVELQQRGRHKCAVAGCAESNACVYTIEVATNGGTPL